VASKEESYDYYHNRGGKEKKQKHYLSKRTSILKSRYGITEDDYSVLFNNQQGCCAICGVDYTGSKRNLDVDHDHTTGNVRGLLCNNCNRGLGHFQDSPTILLKALEYLDDVTGKGGTCGA
jgi:hypothetical protein